MKILIFILAALSLAVVAFGQDVAQVGEGSALTALTGLSPQKQIYATWAVILFKYLSEFYGSVRAGGGLKRAIMSFWLGDTVPRVIAQDYKAELSNPPFPPKTP